jgi:hypothetical protein
MDSVIVIIYDCPEVINIPLTVRSNWLKNLYPRLRVIEAWDGPTEVGDTPGIKKRHEDYVIDILKGEEIAAFYSSEFYGEHISKALGAINRLVDTERQRVKISGTEI